MKASEKIIRMRFKKKKPFVIQRVDLCRQY